MKRLVSALALCVVLPALAPAARAASPQDKAAAQALFDEGMKQFKAGNFKEACPKFEASLARFEGLGTRGKLAECYEKVGKVASAWAAYREVAVYAKRAGDKRREQVAEDRAKQLEARLPGVVVEVPAASRVDGLSITRDGEPVEAGAFGVRVVVDPGAHVIEATAPNHAPWRSEISVAEAATQTVTVPVLTEVAGEPTAPVAPAAPEEPATHDTGAPDAATSPLRTVGMVAVGVGAASVLVGGYFGLSASSKWNGAFDDGHCKGSVCDATGQDQTDSARSAATLSNVFIGAGAVVAATGAVLWITAPKEKSPAQIGVAPAGLGAVMTGRF